MRILAIASAVAASLVAGGAYALGPTATYDIVLTASGSSAFQVNFKNEVANLCAGGAAGATYDYYHIPQTAPGKPSAGQPGMEAYSCTTTSDPAIISDATLQGKNLIAYYRYEGGSAYGVAPIAKNQQIYRLKVDGGCTGAHPDYTCTVNGWNFATESFTSGQAELATTQLGISDVEPSKFVGDNWPGGYFGSAPTSAQLGNITGINPMAGQVFSIYVSTDVSATPLALNKDSISAILQGSVTNWQNVPKADGSGFVSAASKPITVCNRDKGSGTRAGVGFYFNALGCVTGASPLANTGSGTTIYPSTGGELGCVGGGTGRIGYANYQGPTEPTGTVHVLLNGVEPTLKNAAEGRYDYWYEATFNNGSALVAGSSAEKIATLVRNRVGSAANIASSNQSVLPLADYNTPVLPASTSFNPVATVTHNANSCSAPTTVF